MWDKIGKKGSELKRFALWLAAEEASCLRHGGCKARVCPRHGER